MGRLEGHVKTLRRTGLSKELLKFLFLVNLNQRIDLQPIVLKPPETSCRSLHLMLLLLYNPHSGYHRLDFGEPLIHLQILAINFLYFASALGVIKTASFLDWPERGRR